MVQQAMERLKTSFGCRHRRRNEKPWNSRAGCLQMQGAAAEGAAAAAIGYDEALF